MRVLIVDDHKLLGEAVCSSLSEEGWDVLPVATTAQEGVRVAESSLPDLVLVDLGLPDESGVEVGRRLRERVPRATVVALTALSDSRLLQDVMKAGFHGYVTKDTSMARLKEAIKTAANGQVVLPHRLAAGAAGHLHPEERHARLMAEQLTDREREVLGLLVEGSSSTHIARRLSISPNTVRTHIQNILTKLQVHSRLEAATFAVRYGIVRVGSDQRLVALP